MLVSDIEGSVECCPSLHLDASAQCVRATGLTQHATAADEARSSFFFCEEEWFEYMERSTEEAMQRDGNSKNPMLDQKTQKNEMETGDENRFATRRMTG